MKTHGVTIRLAFLGALVMSCHGRSDTPSVSSNTATAAGERVHDVASVYHTFRKVAPVLAGYRLNILESEDFNHTEASSGALLKKTIHHLEQTISAYHRALQPEEKAVLNNGLLVAERLEKGDKVSEEELKRTLQTIDHEVVKWNQEIEK
jgi:hypothetical protein